MTSTLSWLDVSAEQQRRVREMVRLFDEPGTRDELGIGPVRDAFSDLLFPGTSVIQTRARYFVFVPWHFKEAERRGLRGQQLLDRVERTERQLIDQYRKDGHLEGLIGRQAGRNVKILPSTIYWGGLERFGILRAPMTNRAVAQLSGAAAQADDEAMDRPTSAWHATLPPVPPGFPKADTGGFDLRRAEALFLKERIAERAPGTLLSHLVTSDPLTETYAPWEEPCASLASTDARDILEHARRFSLVMHGAALVYNLLIGEEYERSGFDRIDDPVDRYRERLVDWASALDDEHDRSWDWQSFWATALRGNPRIPQRARSFVERWVRELDRVGALNVGDDTALRELIKTRALALRKGRAVLGNRKLLAMWGGSSGASSLNYRWGTVQDLVVDIQEGLARRG